MIINVSGRTDIVAFYMDWFLNRLEDGYFLVRNPFFKNLIHKINCEDIDLIVFCTKNPTNLLKNIDKINKPFILQVTITPYGKDFEPYVLNKLETIDIVKKISKIIGIDRVFVRYDPIIINDKYTLDYHIHSFKSIVDNLCGYTNSIIISFVDEYKNVKNNKDVLNNRELTELDYQTIGKEFYKAAIENDMTVQTCGEINTLFEFGFIQEDCVSPNLVYKLTGKNDFGKWSARGDKNCNCVRMYDVGYYNSCKHFCKYCYANYDERQIVHNYSKHDPNSPLLIGVLSDKDIIKDIKREK